MTAWLAIAKTKLYKKDACENLPCENKHPLRPSLSHLPQIAICFNALKKIYVASPSALTKPFSSISYTQISPSTYPHIMNKTTYPITQNPRLRNLLKKPIPQLLLLPRRDVRFKRRAAPLHFAHDVVEFGVCSRVGSSLMLGF